MKTWPKQQKRSSNDGFALGGPERPPRGFPTNLRQSKLEMLRRASQFAAVLLIIAVVAMPVMACVMPNRQMTAEEQSCCKKMAYNCESSRMPASHSCCQHPVSRLIANVTTIWTGDIGFCVTAMIETPFSPAISMSRGAAHPFESPPESPLKISTVLRI
jgi:hypothetical protein